LKVSPDPEKFGVAPIVTVDALKLSTNALALFAVKLPVDVSA
jgi:hypothetical protein